jgi:DNA-binding HxlR family transcriptional regulator
MKRRYDRYCPMAHALDLIGERWALLVVLELLHGPKRYSDLADALPGIGTNILAARLRDLEARGIVTRHVMPPPAASRVYDLTDYGRELRPVMRELALWGARSLGPPTDEDQLFEGWIANAVDCVLAPIAPSGHFEFRAGGDVASLINGVAQAGSVGEPDVVVTGTPQAIYYKFVEHRLDVVEIDGDRSLLERLVSVAPRTLEAPIPA